jgi:hypothetical protein
MANEKLTYVTDFLVGKNDTGKAVDGLSSKLSGLGNSAGNVLKVIGGVVGGFALGAAIKKLTDAASKQEDAINSLNSALESSGKFSDEASKKLQGFASQLQKTSKFGDTLTLGALARLSTLTKKLGSDDLIKAQQAAADLAAALGLDLQTATDLVAKSINGNTGALNKYGISVKKGKDETEGFANTLNALSKFQGRAEAETFTFSGAIAQLNNSFSDISKEIGFFIIQSPIIINSIKELTKLFDGFAESLKGLEQNPLSEFFNAISITLIEIIRFAEGVLQKFFEIIGEFVNALDPTKGEGGITGTINKWKKFGERISESFAEGLDLNTPVASQLEKLLIDLNAPIPKPKRGQGSAGISDGQDESSGARPAGKGGESFSLGFGEYLEQLRKTLETSFTSFFSSLQQGAAGASGFISGLATQFLGPVAGQVASLLMMNEEQLRETLDSFFQAIPELIKNIITNIPVIIEALILGLVDAFVVLSEKVDVIVDKFISGFIRATPRIVEGLIKALPKFIGLALKLFAIGIIPAIAGAIGNAIKGLIPSGGSGGLFGKAVNFLGQSVNTSLNVGTGGLWGVATGQGNNPVNNVVRPVSGVVNTVAGWFKSGVPTQRGSDLQVIESKIEINQREFGKIILQLSRNNARLAL